MVRKEELLFARRAVGKGLIPGDKILECIELLNSGYAKENTTLIDVMVDKGYISRKQVREIQQDLTENAQKKETAPEKKDTKRIGCYELIEKTGEGAMGSVYKAKNTINNHIVAVKVMDPELAADKEFIARFLREARNAAKLKSHENIVEAYDFGEDTGRYYFAMEFVDGRSLAEILYERGKIGERTALNITKQVTQALVHANNFSIVHRDIKPENIIISNDGIVKLCDLGLAKDRSQDISRASGGITLGTAYYASPEQARGLKNLDIRADIYSLGISLYYMIAGELPFDDPDPIKVIHRHINEPIPPLESKTPEVSQDTVKLVNKMVEKKVEDRYQTPEEVLHDIENIVQRKTSSLVASKKEETQEKKSETTVLKKKNNTSRWHRWISRHYLIVILWVILIVLAIFCVLVAL